MTTGTTRHAPLAMDAATFRAVGHRLVDQLADSLASVALGPVTRAEAPSAVREALDLTGPLPASGSAPGRLRLRANTHMDSQGGAPEGPWRRVDPVDSDRRETPHGCGGAAALAGRGHSRGRCAVSRRRNRRIGEHGCGRSAARYRRRV